MMLLNISQKIMRITYYVFVFFFTIILDFSGFFLLVYEIVRTIPYPEIFGQGSVFMFQGLSLIFCLLLQLHIPGRAYKSKI